MKYLVAALCVGFLAWAAWQHLRRLSPTDARDRFVMVRGWMFMAVVGFFFLAAFLFLPNKGRVVLMLPVFLAGASFVKWMNNRRLRSRDAARERSKFEQARRIN